MNHTKEPWFTEDVFGEQKHDGSIAVCAGLDRIGNPHPIVCTFGVDIDQPELAPKTKKEATANAERIVACVNALAGISEPQAMAHALDLIRQAVWCLEQQDRPATALVVADRLKSLWEQAMQASYQPLTTDPVSPDA